MGKKRKIIGYKIFASEEEFINWQLENRDKTVAVVSPMPELIKFSNDVEFEDVEYDMTADIQFHVFVTYIKEMEDGEEEKIRDRASSRD